MTGQIEFMDARRRRYLRGYLIAFVIFMVTWILRYILRRSVGIPIELYYLNFGLILIALVVQAVFAIALFDIKRKIQKDPQLNVALNNELVRLHETQAWRFAFIVIVACLISFGIVSLFIDIDDLIFVILTSILAGSGGYHAAFYFLEREVS